MPDTVREGDAVEVVVWNADYRENWGWDGSRGVVERLTWNGNRQMARVRITTKARAGVRMLPVAALRRRS